MSTGFPLFQSAFFDNYTRQCEVIFDYNSSGPTSIHSSCEKSSLWKCCSSVYVHYGSVVSFGDDGVSFGDDGRIRTVFSEILVFCTYACNVSMYGFMYVRLYACMYVRMYVCTIVCMYVCANVCMHGHMYARWYACMYVWMYLCLCVSQYYAYMHTNSTQACIRIHR